MVVPSNQERGKDIINTVEEKNKSSTTTINQQQQTKTTAKHCHSINAYVICGQEPSQSGTIIPSEIIENDSTECFKLAVTDT